MSYYIQINQEWNYDDLESEEILLFSVPDELIMNNGLLMEYFDDNAIEYENKQYNIVVLKKHKFWYSTDISQFLDTGRLDRKSFIDWLENKKNIKLLEFNIIGQ